MGESRGYAAYKAPACERMPLRFYPLEAALEEGMGLANKPIGAWRAAVLPAEHLTQMRPEVTRPGYRMEPKPRGGTGSGAKSGKTDVLIPRGFYNQQQVSTPR